MSAISTCVAVLLVSCGRPDASGLYVYASDRNVVLLQLVETKNGNVTGRLERVTVASNGTVSYQSAAVDGVASGHDLMFKPASAWYGGLAVTGTFSSNGLTLTGMGRTLDAQRSNLGEYKAAVARLQSVAAGDRQRIASLQAAQMAHVAQVQAARNVAEEITKIEAATIQLRDDTAKMNSGIAACPDFGKRSAMNTERIAKMLRIAPTLSEVDRNQLVVAANQVEVATNQIEVARSQYAIELNDIVQDAGPLADKLQGFCTSPQGAQFAEPCIGAKAAAVDFQTSLARGRNSFIGYKQAVQDELSRQSAMIQRMGG
jgi:hypothetical protein